MPTLKFSEQHRVLADSDIPITALCIVPNPIGCIAYGNSRGQIFTTPAASWLMRPTVRPSHQMSGEVLVLSHGISAEAPYTNLVADLAAGDSCGYVTVRGRCGWRREFQAHASGVESLSLGTSTLVTACDTQVKAWTVSEGGKAGPNCTFRFDFSGDAFYKLETVRLVAYHEEDETITVVDVKSKAFQVDSISGIVRETRDLGRYIVGTVRMKRSPDWNNSAFAIGVPGVGFAISKAEGIATIQSGPRVPSSTPVIAATLGFGIVFGSAPDQLVEVWDTERSSQIQKLQIPDSKRTALLSCLEFGTINSVQCVATVIEKSNGGWSLVAWDVLKNPSDQQQTVSLVIDYRFIFGIVLFFGGLFPRIFDEINRYIQRL